jgi:hypothetical protein
MSDKKISQLTASTTPLTGAEVLAVVQSGVTKQVSVNNLTAGKAVNGLTFTANGRATIRTTSIADAPSPTGNNVGIAFAGGPSIAPTDGNGSVANGSVDIGRSDAKWKDAYLAGNVIIGTSGKGIDFSADGQAAGMTSELLDDYEEGTFTPNQGTGLTVTGSFSSSGTYIKIGKIVFVTGVLSGSTSVACSAYGQLCSNLPFVKNSDFSFGSVSNSSLSAITPAYQAALTANINSGAAIAASTNIYFQISYSVS